MASSLWKLLFLASAVLAQSRTPVSKALFADLVTYANLTAASLNQPCPTPPSRAVVVGYISSKQTDTQATVFRRDSAKELVLSIPGTTSKYDMYTDTRVRLVPITAVGTGDCKNCTVHAGFLAAWNSISATAIKLLSTELAAHPSYQVVVTGHSLGGGIAAIATASLTGLSYPVKAIYTYGQSRSGNKAFADYIDAKCGASSTEAGIFHRVTHENDPIPQCLLQANGYEHSRTEYWETDAADGTQTAALTYMCSGEDPTNCNEQVWAWKGFGKAHSRYSNVAFGKAVSCGI